MRRTRLYQSLVDSTLRFLIEQVGQVEDAYPGQDKLAENFLFRRAAGNGLEVAGILAFRASPVWVMAALADLSGTGRHLVREISEELKSEGLLPPEASFETVDQMLDGLERTAARLAEAINTPPLDVAGLRREWAEIRTEAASIPPADLPSVSLLESQWRQLKQAAANQQRSVFEVSALVALSTIRSVPDRLWWLSRCAQTAARKTGRVLAAHLLEHYSEALSEIQKVGYFRYWVREFRPYLAAAARQFSPSRESLTQRLWSKT